MQYVYNVYQTRYRAVEETLRYVPWSVIQHFSCAASSMAVTSIQNFACLW